MAVSMLALLTACGGRPETVSETASAYDLGSTSEADVPFRTEPVETVDEENGVTTVSIANPFVEATDSEITSELNIPMDSSFIAGVETEYIVGKTFAQIDFMREDVNGNNVGWTLRATRDADEAENLHGLYFDDFSEPVLLGGDGMGVELTFRSCGGDKWNIYSWNNDGIYYTLTHDGPAVSQMQTAAVLDEVLAAVGITE